MRTTSILLVVVLMVMYAINASATRCGDSMGLQLWHTTIENGWEPIVNINDEHIQELGSWAVLEFNKHVNCTVKFNKVLSGRQQLVSGMNYELIIDVTHFGGEDGNYKAELYEQELTKKRQLLSFTKVK
ncbi:Cysteine proteinase inhibitor 8 [Triticum urartu]|uniref:Cysteine proteinase inhibitor 8 n=1 Tax=Triticum urartu TaxID=4572 RepID=M7ZA37_TRIUA|nr:cysteine proteinase inhibitor 8-like [Triticum dicoccoides]EMS56927.1 Cysteine proteinase inhibitor 8 [Triticum urartu]